MHSVDLLQRGYRLGPAVLHRFDDGPPALGGLRQLPVSTVQAGVHQQQQQRACAQRSERNHPQHPGPARQQLLRPQL